MALSNWATCAIDEKGNPTEGIFKSPLGVVVKIYKNWLYVEDAKSWNGGAYKQPTVMEIQEGDIHYKDVEITAKREESQNGVFAVVCSGYGEDKKIMIGCGVYAYDGKKEVGVNSHSLNILKTLAIEHQIPWSGKTEPFNQGDALFVGIGGAKKRMSEGKDTVFSEVLNKVFK